MSVVAPPHGPARPPTADPEALIEEARRRQRRRRRRVAALALALASAGAGAYLLIGGDAGPIQTAGRPRGASVAVPRAPLTLHLRGFGTPLPTSIDSGPCPQGHTLISITSATGRSIGTADVCVLTIEKADRPYYGVVRIFQTVLETDALPGGSIVSKQAQTILFARDQRHTIARFRGRIVGGTGRYRHARGSVSGGGPGVDDVADWRVTLTFR